MTPSQLLNHMRCLNGNHEETPLFKEIFLRQLPNHTRSILAICSSDTALSTLANKADAIISYNEDICHIQPNKKIIHHPKNMDNQFYHYHNKFGNNARKYVSPCSFNKQGN